MAFAALFVAWLFWEYFEVFDRLAAVSVIAVKYDEVAGRSWQRPPSPCEMVEHLFLGHPHGALSGGVRGAAFLVLVTGSTLAPSTTLTLRLVLRHSDSPTSATSWATCWTVASEASRRVNMDTKVHKDGREPVVQSSVPHPCQRFCQLWAFKRFFVHRLPRA